MTTWETMVPCPRCRRLITPALVGACASVGIEHGLRTADMVIATLAKVHATNDHEGEP